MGTSQHNRGYTYVELMLSVLLGGILVLGLTAVVGQALDTQQAVHEKNDLARQANEALQRMVHTVLRTRHLLLPLADNPTTNWPEHVREQTVPASAPVGDSTLATAVLAVTLPADVDLDRDGRPDADNDGDGRFDEDLHPDQTRDGQPGIALIDDNGDGGVDDSADADPASDNDEDDSKGEEVANGVDDDGDGSVDEDLRADMNADGQAGVAGVDDDGDGAVDEGNQNDDDEDGSIDEDSYEAVVFYLDAAVLVERMPVPWDANGDGQVNGLDFALSPLARNVSRFRVGRVPQTGGRWQLVDLRLDLTDPVTDEVVSLVTRVRVGGAL